MNQTTWKQITPYLVAVLIVIYFIYMLFGSGSSDTGNSQLPSSSGQGQTATASQQSAESSYNEISVRDLPREAHETLQLIKQGGPFPYKQDNTVFSNREGLLPAKSSGYYHEYTVITPGSLDRGARRIVSGSTGEYYYTADHYRSFKRIRE